jgi:hypothetical protein
LPWWWCRKVLSCGDGCGECQLPADSHSLLVSADMNPDPRADVAARDPGRVGAETGRPGPSAPAPRPDGELGLLRSEEREVGERVV